MQVSVKVSNVGNRKGETVVQLYFRDLAASIVRPVKELKGFCKVSLEPGESQNVEFELGEEELSFYGLQGRKEAEPGRFQVFAGLSSRDQDLLSDFFDFKGIVQEE